MNRKLNGLLSILGLSICIILVILGLKGKNPEQVIIGNWNETDWAYEKIENESVLEMGLAEIKKHEAEKWVFRENNTLEFYKDDQSIAIAEWKIKGRGHILRIKHDDGSLELFDIKELNEDEMILNFDIGMETRGIAKLIFGR